MIKRQGPTCEWCGYPLADSRESLCPTCRDWQATTGEARNAETFAAREQQKERQQRWEERRK